MSRLLAMSALLLLSNGCAISCSGGGAPVAGAPGLEALHDAERGVWCWRSIYARGQEVAVALSCLPADGLRAPDAGR